MSTSRHERGTPPRAAAASAAAAVQFVMLHEMLAPSRARATTGQATPGWLENSTREPRSNPVPRTWVSPPARSATTSVTRAVTVSAAGCPPPRALRGPSALGLVCESPPLSRTR